MEEGLDVNKMEQLNAELADLRSIWGCTEHPMTCKKEVRSDEFENKKGWLLCDVDAMEWLVGQWCSLMAVISICRHVHYFPWTRC
eukprot:4471800-Amphidinium_carterae.1